MNAIEQLSPSVTPTSTPYKSDTKVQKKSSSVQEADRMATENVEKRNGEVSEDYSQEGYAIANSQTSGPFNRNDGYYVQQHEHEYGRRQVGW